MQGRVAAAAAVDVAVAVDAAASVFSFVVHKALLPSENWRMRFLRHLVFALVVSAAALSPLLFCR